MSVLESRIETTAEIYRKKVAAYTRLTTTLAERHATVLEGGGAAMVKRHREAKEDPRSGPD